MGRVRQVNPVYPFEKEIRLLSIPARYFYLLSWCHMSDPNREAKKVGGVLPYDEFFLKSNIFPEETIDITPLIQELINLCRYFPFEAEGKKWLWCPTMPKHQTISHPSKGNYPDPPVALQEDYRSGRLALHLSRVELSRVEGVEKRTEPTAAEAVLKDIYDNYKINVYQVLNQFKKLLKAKKSTILGSDYKIPDEVILGTCASFKKSKVAKPFPWFLKVFGEELTKWWVNKQDKEHQQVKIDAATSCGGDVKLIKDIIEKMMSKQEVV